MANERNKFWRRTYYLHFSRLLNDGYSLQYANIVASAKANQETWKNYGLQAER